MERAGGKGVKELVNKTELAEFLNLYAQLRKKYGGTTSRLIKDFSKDVLLPVSIFNKKLSCLEVIVRYLIDYGLSVSETAKILDRSYTTVQTTLKNAKEKFSESLDTSSKLKIPCSVLANRELSVLENIVLFLKVELNLSFSEISKILHRNQRTIWTVYSRAARKLR